MFLSSTLYGDLQLHGDDLDAFFPRFAAEFGVNLEGVNLGSFFPPEPYLGPRIVGMILRRLLVTADPYRVAQVSPLTVGDLVGWVERGTLEHRAHGT